MHPPADERSRPGGPNARPPGTVRIGQVAGVDILVRASWLLIALLIAVLLGPRIEEAAPGLGGLAYLAGLVFAVLLYLSVLLHELSHALAAKAFKLPVRSVTLHFLGGVTEIEGEPQTPTREFVVSVVGPLTSIAVGFAALFAAFITPEGTLVQMMFGGLAWANLIVGALNLVPGLPLDGGRILRALVWGVTKKPHLGSTVAGWSGRGVAVLAVASPLLLEQFGVIEPRLIDFALAVVIGLFLWQGATQALMSAKIRSRLPALKARSLARRAIAVPADLPLAEGLRRARGAQAGAMVVATGSGLPSAVVNEAAVTATPSERRPWVTCSAVARDLSPGLLLDADLDGESLLRAMQATPATEYVLVEGNGDVYGVLATSDVDAAFTRA
ncbi:MAG TPA: site-2 protease family protein [Nocardioidaceae bacterium]|nr:site-2 protease family protein [Nocardioidaceae bacterium]